MVTSFDPDEDGGLRDFSVSQFCTVINAVFADHLPSTVWVRGVVTKLRPHRNGNHYFDVVELDESGAARATLSCSLLSWNRKGVDAALRTRPDVFVEGAEVRIGGRPRIFAGTGRVTFEMTAIDIEFGVGAQALRKEALLKSLEAEGVLRANGQLPLPRVVRRIALITSVGSAAHHDVVAELQQSRWVFEVHTFDAAMQGRSAAEHIIDAVTAASDASVELICIVRGGGSTSDLATFDNEDLVRTICGLSTPVWVGIGHQVDHSVVDAVAGRSFKTPTALAAALVEARDLVGQQFEGQQQRFGIAVLRALEQPSLRMQQLQQQFPLAVQLRLRKAGESLLSAAQVLRLVDPRRVLEQGFAIVRDAHGHVVRAGGLDSGQSVTIAFSDGNAQAEIVDVVPIEDLDLVGDADKTNTD